MLITYLKVAFRTLIRKKGYSLLTIAGLAVGSAVFLLIALWISDEISYDRFHDKGDRIYRAVWEGKVGDNEWKIPLGPVPLGEALREGFPEVEEVVRIRPWSRLVRHQGSLIREEGFVYAEPSFFRVFTVEFLSGDAATALNAPDNVVLTTTTALKYFGTQHAVGRSIQLSDGTTLRVAAIVKPFPPQSHFRFDFLAPLETLPLVRDRRAQWGSATVYTYVLMKRGTSITALEEKFHKHFQGIQRQGIGGGSTDYFRFRFDPLYDIYLRSNYAYEIGQTGSIDTVYLMSAVAVFILLLACINFMNLTTARANERAREVGVRKVVGADRTQLLTQFFLESVVYVCCAMVFAMALTEITLPNLNAFTAKQLSLEYSNPFVLVLLCGFVLITAFVAGLYPALVISSFSPVSVLKGRLTSNSSRLAGLSIRSVLRSTLVVFQFCVCIALMTGTIVLQHQMQYVMEKNLGFDRSSVLVVRGAGALGEKRRVFVREAEMNPGVGAVSMVQTLPGYDFDSMGFEPEQPANYRITSLTYAMVDEKFVDVLGLKIVEGRNFSTDHPTDSSAFLINRSAAHALGWKHPLGKRLRYGGNVEGRVIGVVDDFHFQSLHSEIKPIVFPFIRWVPQYFAIRLKPGDKTETIKQVKAVWEKLAPERPFEYSFLDQDYERLYQSERRLTQLFGLFAGLALFIACLGLFGLATYSIQQRTKEIGIRKVLGASVINIMGLLSKEFARLVVVALIVATPLAYYGLNRLLQNFAYRVDIGWWVFLVAGGAALLVALATVSFQAIKAALANPVEALRYE
jgi:putative ABC transport system permease protein